MLKHTPELGSGFPGNGMSWTFQFCSRFGWYQMRDDEHPMRSRYVNYTFWDSYCKGILPNMLPKDSPQAKDVNFHYGGIG